MSESSATPPPVGPADHVRGTGTEAIVYLDLGCPECAATWVAIRDLELRLCVRHFPVEPKHPRAPALHAATEAAAAQRESAFWQLWDSIYLDQGHQDDPHLWARARELGLDLARFDRDRRSAAVADRVRRDLDSGIAAGVETTPTAYCAGQWVAAGVGDRLAAVGGRH